MVLWLQYNLAVAAAAPGSRAQAHGNPEAVHRRLANVAPDEAGLWEELRGRGSNARAMHWRKNGTPKTRGPGLPRWGLAGRVAELKQDPVRHQRVTGWSRLNGRWYETSFLSRLPFV